MKETAVFLCEVYSPLASLWGIERRVLSYSTFWRLNLRLFCTFVPQSCLNDVDSYICGDKICSWRFFGIWEKSVRLDDRSHIIGTTFQPGFFQEMYWYIHRPGAKYYGPITFVRRWIIRRYSEFHQQGVHKRNLYTVCLLAHGWSDCVDRNDKVFTLLYKIVKII